jgi:predicted transcriptional regulator
MDKRQRPLMTFQVKREGNKITTSIKIDPEILKEAKHFAIEQNKTFSQILEDALKKEIKKNNTSSR